MSRAARAPFGEIRITRPEPETTVAWEGERASGTVELELVHRRPGTRDAFIAPAPDLGPPALGPEPPPPAPGPAPTPQHASEILAGVRADLGAAHHPFSRG